MVYKSFLKCLKDWCLWDHLSTALAQCCLFAPR
uniref:Uncharacterized protein n=1 Tax=Anguilla anguilla TaxID=7936 RepID=A0A0E9VUK3_ANGAN